MSGKPPLPPTHTHTPKGPCNSKDTATPPFCRFCRNLFSSLYVRHVEEVFVRHYIVDVVFRHHAHPQQPQERKTNLVGLYISPITQLHSFVYKLNGNYNHQNFFIRFILKIKRSEFVLFLYRGTSFQN